MVEYTYDEFSDMHLTYGEEKGKRREARRLYEQRFRTRRIPSYSTFASVDQRLRETSSFAISNSNARRSRNLRTSEIEDRDLARISGGLSTCMREVAYEMGISEKVAWRILHEECMNHYYLQKMQCLHQDDYPAGQNLCSRYSGGRIAIHDFLY